MSTGSCRLEIPGHEPVEIRGWDAMDAGSRKLAVAFAVASRMGVAAGLDLMVIYHMELCQNAPGLAALAEAGWPRARRSFVRECAGLGYVFSDDDRATVTAEKVGAS